MDIPILHYKQRIQILSGKCFFILHSNSIPLRKMIFSFFQNAWDVWKKHMKSVICCYATCVVDMQGILISSSKYSSSMLFPQLLYFLEIGKKNISSNMWISKRTSTFPCLIKLLPCPMILNGSTIPFLSVFLEQSPIQFNINYFKHVYSVFQKYFYKCRGWLLPQKKKKVLLNICIKMQ